MSESPLISAPCKKFPLKIRTEKSRQTDIQGSTEKSPAVSLELNRKVSKSATFYTTPKPRFKRVSISATESRTMYKSKIHFNPPQLRPSVETIISEGKKLTFNFLPPVDTGKRGNNMTICAKLGSGSGNGRGAAAITRINTITPHSLSHSITRSPVASSSDEVANMIQSDSALFSNIPANPPATAIDLTKVYDRTYRPTLRLPKCSTMSVIKPYFIDGSLPQCQGVVRTQLSNQRGLNYEDKSKIVNSQAVLHHRRTKRGVIKVS